MKREIDGVEYCTVHGGVMIEGETDDRCMFGYIDSDEECDSVSMFYENSAGGIRSVSLG